MYKPGDIVWADLGSSYGWWPGTVAEKGQFPKSRFQDVKSDHPEHITKSETAETGKDLQPSLKPDDEAPSQSDDLKDQALKEVNSETGSPPRKKSHRSCGTEKAPSIDMKSSVETEVVNKEMIDVRVHFFDDDKHEHYTITDPDRLCMYTDKMQKLKLIKAGLKKFEAKPSKGSMFDYRARQAQFYKDVEMAEVMTDNSIQVANLLAQYTVVDGTD